MNSTRGELWHGDRTGSTAAPSPATIAIAGLVVDRGGNRVLPGLDLELRAGEVSGLLGPSGSGKSTLLRSIVGVQRQTAGEVSVLGLPAGTAELRRRLAYVTQAPSVYLDLTVNENLAYFAAVLGVGRGEIAAGLSRVGLTDHTNRTVGTLSGGERSRASLAAALLGDPEVLILDEPTVGLDPVLRQSLWRTFHELADSGKTVLVSTHVMDEAERCDHLVLIREGEVVAAEPPPRLLARTGARSIEEAFIALAEQGR
jgi:ABC-2 type transport system ATP-binding protein